MQNNQESYYIHSALMLEWIGQTPIMIHRAFIDLTGNVLTALWLSYAVEKAKECIDQDGGNSVLISMPASECEKQTGITRAQQQTCRKSLIALGLLTEEGQSGKPLNYRIHTQKLMRMLENQVQPVAEAIRHSELIQSSGSLTTQGDER